MTRHGCRQRGLALWIVVGIIVLLAGLGLALTQHIVEMHDGRLSAASPADAGAGAEMVIELPPT